MTKLIDDHGLTINKLYNPILQFVKSLIIL